MEARVLALKEQGNAHVAKRKWPAALRCYAEALAADPDNVARQAHVLHSNAAAVHQECARFAEAEAAAKRAIQAEPAWPRGYARLAAAYESQCRFVAAAGIVGKLLQLEPNQHAAAWLVQLQGRAAEDSHEQEATMLAALADARAAARGSIPPVEYVLQTVRIRYGDGLERKPHLFDFVATLALEEQVGFFFWLRAKGRIPASLGPALSFRALAVARGFAEVSDALLAALERLLPAARFAQLARAVQSREAESPPDVAEGGGLPDEPAYWLRVAEGDEELAAWFGAQTWDAAEPGWFDRLRKAAGLRGGLPP